MSRWTTPLLLGLAACAGAPVDEPSLDDVELCERPPALPDTLQPIEELAYVAHAGGSPDGLAQSLHYTNSRQGWEASYANGFRVFELDFITLGDGTVVAAHDYDEDKYGFEDGTFPELTRADLEGARWNGRYPLLFAEDVIELLVDYPTTWLIIDSKWDDLEVATALVELAPDDSVRDRLVPHFVSDEHAAGLAALYPFPERMLAVYQWGGGDAAQLDRMATHGIDNIMMWWDSRWSEATQAAMEAAGHHVWVHTPAEPATITGFVDRGIGVYSNGWIECP